MIPDIIGVCFLLLPWVCLLYVFRGISSESNPLLGNVLASGLSMIISGMCLLWLLQGSIVSPSLVPNASYALPAGSTAADMANYSIASHSLGTGGSGMYQSAALTTANNTSATSITVFTHSIVYSQFQNFGLALLYALLTIISVCLLGYFIYCLYQAITMPDELGYEQ